jgi:serine protease Do
LFVARDSTDRRRAPILPERTRPQSAPSKDLEVSLSGFAKAAAGLAAAAVLWFAGARTSALAIAQTHPVDVQVRHQLGGVPVALDTVTASTLSGAFRGAANVALPAVVQIRVINRDDRSSRWRRNAGTDEPEDNRSAATGSGFVYDDQGHILTNNHVIESAERVTVVLADGRDFNARVVGADPNTDVAIIRVDRRPGEVLPVSQVGDSDALRVGDWVLALGNPLGLQFTVTAGIVSAKGRSIDILRNSTNTQLESFIQTDAAINPGNSGGPMVDLLGRVVGINSAIESRTGYFSGAGFAIPMNLARKVADDLIRYGVVHRPRLGVIIQDVTAADAEVYRLPAIVGAEIASVTPGEPAANAGMQMGDVVVSLNEESIQSVTDLQAKVARFQPGEKVRLGVIRYGSPLEVTVQLGEFKPGPERVAATPRPAAGAALLGFRVGVLSQRAARLVGRPTDETVAITEVDPFGPAADAAVPRNGVILLKINGKDIHSERDVQAAAAGLRPGEVVSLVVLPPTGEDAAPTIYNYRVR